MNVGVIVGIVLVVLVLIWYVMTYNRLVRMRNECDRAWSNIDVLLQQRYDMLPNLVNTVRDMPHMNLRFSLNLQRLARWLVLHAKQVALVV